MKAFFPAVLEGPDETGGYGVEVIGTGVNGCGDDAVSALRNAAEILQEVIDDLASGGEPVPAPGTVTVADMARGTVAMLQAELPVAAA